MREQLVCYAFTMTIKINIMVIWETFIEKFHNVGIDRLNEMVNTIIEIKTWQKI